MSGRRYGQTIHLPGGDPETVNEPESNYPYPGMIGAVFTINRPQRSVPTDPATGLEKQYRLVRTDSTMTVSPYAGATAWWAERDQFRVTTSPTTLGRGRVAGVFTYAATVGNLTCIQRRGPRDDVKFIDGPAADPTAAGLIVIPSATAAKADCLAAGTAATYPIMGKSIGALNQVTMEAAVDLNVDDGEQ
jgi:hypothetical protein